MAKIIKNRYILAESSAQIDFNDPANQRALESGIMHALGTLNYSYSNPKMMLATEKQFILRIQRNSEDSTILALSFIKSINGKTTGIYTIKTSGTMKSLKEQLIKNNK